MGRRRRRRRKNRKKSKRTSRVSDTLNQRRVARHQVSITPRSKLALTIAAAGVFPLVFSSRRRSGTALLCRLSRHPGLQTELPGCGKLVFAPEAQSRAKYSAPNFVCTTPGFRLGVGEDSELRLRKEGHRGGGNL